MICARSPASSLLDGIRAPSLSPSGNSCKGVVVSIKISFLTAVMMLLMFGNFASADTIVDFDFEGTNDPSFIYGYSESSQLTYNTDLNSANGMGGTEGGEISIAGQTGTPAWAGGGIGFFDLSVDSRFVAGAITAANLDLLSVEFDAEVVGRAVSTVRIESGGSYGNRVELMPSMSGSFQSYSFDFASLDAVQKANLAAHMNSSGATDVLLVFTFIADGSGDYEIGNAVRLDNFKLTSTVPEPNCWFMLLGLGASAVSGRRRYCC